MKLPAIVNRLFNPGVQEHRASYTEALAAQAYANATEPQSAPGALAVVESCTSLIADPLLVATVTGYALTGGTLQAMGRDVLRTGNSVWLIDLGPDGSVQLLRASAFEVGGRSPNPARWSYAVEMETPAGTITRRAPAARVIHVLTDAPPGRSWRGNAPWTSAPLSSAAMAEIERGVRDESKIINGRIWVSPDGATQDQSEAMARSIGSIKGGRQTVAETTNQGWGQGKLASPKVDWTPTKVGMEHDPANVSMRESVQASIAASYGVHPAWFAPTATAPGIREVKRLAFLSATLPLARIIADELSLKLETRIGIGWPNMADQSVDVHLRARAVQALVAAGVSSEDALVAGGLAGVVLADDDDLDDVFRQKPSANDARATGLVVQHLRDGKVVESHDADSPCEICKARSKQTNGQTNGAANGGVEHASL